MPNLSVKLIPKYGEWILVSHGLDLRIVLETNYAACNLLYAVGTEKLPGVSSEIRICKIPWLHS